MSHLYDVFEIKYVYKIRESFVDTEATDEVNFGFYNIHHLPDGNGGVIGSKPLGDKWFTVYKNDSEQVLYQAKIGTKNYWGGGGETNLGGYVEKTFTYSPGDRITKIKISNSNEGEPISSTTPTVLKYITS